MKYYVNSIATASLLALLSACGGSDNNNTSVPPANDPPAAAVTKFAVSVNLPAGSTVVKNDNFNPLGWFISESVAVDEAVSGLDLTNFEVRLLNDDGTTAEVVAIDEFEDNGDGTYFISVAGDPRIDCILVSIVQVDGNAVTLEIPAVDAGSQADPVELSYASTAATRQYVSSVVEAGGFSQISDELSADEVEALIDDVVEDLGAILIPDGVDTNDPSAVIAALEQSAGDFIAAQIEIVAAPPPEAGSLDKFQGNYHASVFDTGAFGGIDPSSNFFLTFNGEYEDFSLGDGQTTLSGINITVDEQNLSASLVLGGSIENDFEIVYSGAGAAPVSNLDVEINSDAETIPASITPSGKLFLQPPTVQLEGFLFQPEGERRYFVSISNQSPIPLHPWGSAYIGSSIGTENEYFINDCLNDLGFTQAQVDALDEEGFEDLIEGLNATLVASINVLNSACQENAFGAEVFTLALAKKPTDASLVDITGEWGVLGMFLDLAIVPEGTVGNGVMTIGTDGNGLDGDGVDIDINFEDGSYLGSEDTFSGGNSVISISSEGIVSITYTDDGDDDVYEGYVNDDFSLITLPGFEPNGDALGLLAEVELGIGYMVPLSTGHTTAELDGLSFDLVGQVSAFEAGELADTGRLSFNQDSLEGLTLSFSADGDAINVALSGSTDLLRFDRFFGQGGTLLNYSIDTTVDTVTNGVNFGTATLADNGALTIIAEDGSTRINGFIDKNGRLAVTIISADSANFDELNTSGNTVFSDVNLGYALGVPSN